MVKVEGRSYARFLRGRRGIVFLDEMMEGER